MPIGQAIAVFRWLPAACVLSLWLSAPGMAEGEAQAQPWIRVAVATGASRVVVRSTGPCRVHELEATECLASFDGSHTFTFERSAGRVRLVGLDVTASIGFSIASSDDSGRLEVGGRSYRRTVRVVVWDGALACVNALPLEEYLWGVVPCEVPPSWPTEALRAQAVAARTYSLRALEQYPDRPFDVYADVTDQVYRGTGRERETTTDACRDTFGEVCCFNGTPIVAYFHSAAGGWTASGAEMFGRDLPYLRAVPSRDASVHRWSYRISAGDLARALRASGRDVGTIQRAWVHQFSAEGRAEKVKIVHSGGVLLVGGADLRRILGPGNIQSTYFTVEGQAAPEIPESSPPIVPEGPAQTVNPLQRYASSHPRILVPLPVARELNSCSIIASEGACEAERLVVIGASEVREYVGGYVWVARPVRAGQLHRGLDEGNMLSMSGAYAPIGNGQVVENPGSGVGMPRNGGFAFVGHGCGHGVGMSQHGARILAESGWAYELILKYFYSGVEIERFW